MARIKNMGTATMKFGEGIIVSGSAGNTTDSLIVSGTAIFKDDMQLDVNKRIYFDGSSVANGPYIYGNTTSMFIDGDDRVTLSMDKDLRVLDEDNNAIIHVTDKDATSNDVYKVFDDTNIFFSGSIGSVDGAVFGASTFGGDLVSSGTIYAGKGSGLSEGLIVEGDTILSGNVFINLGGDGEALKIVGTLQDDNYIVFEQPVGTNRAYLGLDSGDNLDIVNNSANDDINIFTTAGGSTKATLVATAGNRVGIGKFGWAGKTEYGHGEAFPRDELDVSGSMRVSEDVELMGQSLVVSGTITGRYDDQIPGNALMFKNTEVYFVTTDDDVNNKVMAPDENIFFSGSIGSMKTLTKGTAVFGGDLVVSGAISAGAGNTSVQGLTVNANISGDYAALIDNDQSNQGHGLKVTSDGTGAQTNVFDVESVSNSLFRIRGDGRVGIGTTSPSTLFHVDGATTINTNLHVSGSTSIQDYMIISVSADNTDLQTGTSLVTLRAPFAMDLYQIPRASLSTNGTTGTTVDINVGGTTIMTTNKLTIDANEGTSTTAATAAALTTTSITDDQQITIDVDTAGTGARGLKVTLYYRRNI